MQNLLINKYFWRVIAVVLTLLVLYYAVILSLYLKSADYNACFKISNTLGYCRTSDGGYVYNISSKEILISDVDSIIFPYREAIFCRNNKQGYFNMNDGKIIVQPQYDEIWPFNSGCAAVAINDSIYFINKRGQPINNKKFRRILGEDYEYVGEYCRIKIENKYGLIDYDGDWVVEPIYDEIDITPYGLAMWSNYYENGSFDYGHGFVKNGLMENHYMIEIKEDTILYTDRLHGEQRFVRLLQKP